MKKPLDNPYSKYRYDNTYSLKFRVDPSARTTRLYGAELRSYRDNLKAQIPNVPETWANTGATWVINNVFRCNQVNIADQPVVDYKNASRWTFFKLFKL